MTKKIYNFSKGFIPCAILSTVVILFGIFGLVFKGINFGIDFRPGLVEEVKIAPASAELSYSGDANAVVEVSNTSLIIVVSGIGAENMTKTYLYSQYPTIADIASAIDVPGVKVSLLTDGSESSYSLYVDSSVSMQLSQTPLSLYAKSFSGNIDDVRSVVESIQGASFKPMGTADNRSFQIRIPVEKGSDSNDKVVNTINSVLDDAFGRENIAVIKTDFIGSTMSKSLATKAILFLILTFVMIWAYSAIRFHWDFALGAIVALLHDTLIMFSFIVWTRMEFTTTVFAAVLTIVGYSINDTVVILDRVRDNLRKEKVSNFNQLLNMSLSETLSRSIITTVTTMFAALSLYVFASGSIKDFALALIVGLISGCYSSIFISSGFISMCRRNWKPEYGIHHSDKTARGVLKMDSGVQV